MHLTVFHIKLIHTAIFAVLGACVLYVLASGVVDRITLWTWGAIAAIVAEGIVLWLNGGKCPLTAVLANSEVKPVDVLTEVKNERDLRKRQRAA